MITGGAGFIGSNLADALLREGRDVIIFDNLSRKGVEQNLHWLTRRHGKRLTFRAGDLRDAAAVAAVVATGLLGRPSRCPGGGHREPRGSVGGFFRQPARHHACSGGDPAQGRAHAAGVRQHQQGLGGIATTLGSDRHLPRDPTLAAKGISEAAALRLATPYGCSKGAADQYVLDYARSFGIPAVVLRMSCIYGPRQFGTEDQGWVAHFLRRALR